MLQNTFENFKGNTILPALQLLITGQSTFIGKEKKTDTYVQL